MKTISLKKFFKNYKPIKNPAKQGFEKDAYENTLFEINPASFDEISNRNKSFVWTLVSGEKETSWILPGYHVVNRKGFFITRFPWVNNNIQINDNEMISVGVAKYLCIDFINDVLKIDLTVEQEDQLHQFWSENT